MAFLDPVAVRVGGALLLLAGSAVAGQAAAPTFQELMDPSVFPEPQRGMVVESARLTGNRLEVVTTGAQFVADLRRGEITCRQRIGHERPVVRLRLGKALRGARLTHRGPGLARVTCTSPRLTIRINGDSLLMLHAHEPLAVPVDRLILPAWHASFQANHIVLDEWGGFGLYCSATDLKDDFDLYADPVARYRLPADAVLWVGVCPPKPYDWERSLKDNVVWHWSDTEGYPPDDVLRSWKELGNIVLLQSEVMLWKDWNLDFVPRLGPEEFARVRKTLHDLGMRFIVYTSPYYFLKGTALEGLALNSFENFKGWPPGTPTGENIELFMPAITRVMREYKPDGLYFDGQYTDNPAALYALARRTRALLGEEGILEWHSTWALGPSQCSLPQADAYVDFILRGEGVDARYGDFDYLRFFVSGYNVHNSIGVICNNGPTQVTPELASTLLRVNGRFHTIAGWAANPKVMETLRTHYQARLTPALREEVDHEVDRRQAEIAAVAARNKTEIAALKAEPKWDQPLFRADFAKIAAAKQVVSPHNQNPFTVADGVLRVRGYAHTHAYLSYPLPGKARGFVVRLRHGSDGGMSWGPSVALRLANNARIRIGTRADGELQADINGEQLHGDTYRISEWIWLRARWTERWGVVECSNDGKRYRMVWRFSHAGTMNGEPVELLIGKVPYHAQPQDNADRGDLGECEIGAVTVY